MKQKYFLISSLAANLLFASCGVDNNESEDNLAEVDTLNTEVKTDQTNETFFQVPSPGEMLTFIKMVGGKSNKNVSD